MKKRIVALLLCCVMLLTLSPSLIASASADDKPGTAVTEPTEPTEPTEDKKDAEQVEEVKDETKDEVKDETKDEVKDETKAETKDEVKDEAKEEQKPADEPKNEEQPTTPEEPDDTYEAPDIVKDAPELPEILPEVDEGLINAVNFDRVAPLLTMTSGSTLRRAPSRVAEQVVNNSGVQLKKTADYDAMTGDVTIRMEAYATGTSTITTTTTPVDIVLVLDQSKSMAEKDFKTVSGYTYKEYTSKTNNDHYQNQNNLYYKDGNEYRKVSISTTVINSYTQIPDSTPNYAILDSSYWSYRNRLYEKTADGEYAKVTVTYTGNWLDGYIYTYKFEDGYTVTSSGNAGQPDFETRGPLYYQSGADYRYTYTYVDGNNQTVTLGSSDGRNTSPTSPDVTGLPLYLRSANNTGTMSRKDALTKAVTAFVDEVAKKADPDGKPNSGDEVAHRIAVVGFASDSGNGNNTEILSVAGKNSSYSDGKIGVKLADLTDTQYKSALKDMSKSADRTMVNNAIAALDANGGTYIDSGLKITNSIFEKNPSKDSTGKEIRKRVVIIFTDGEPGYNSNDADWSKENTRKNPGDTLTVANLAIKEANKAKNTYGATVYTVGIFNAADGATPMPSDASNANKYMHYMSSNFKSAQSMNNPGAATYPGSSTGYYLSAGDSDTLMGIFQKISQEIENSQSSTELNKTAVIKDIIAPSFELPEGAKENDITLKTAPYMGKDSEGNDAFGIETDAAESVKASISTDSKTVSVTGFDFKENWCGSVTKDGKTTYRGQKLIIEFTVKVRDGFLGGNDVYTNDAKSGIYEKSDSKEPLDKFPQPTVNVEIKDVTVTAEDKNVYLLGEVTAAQLQEGAKVNVGGVILDLSKATDEDKPYGLEKWQTEYVNITATVKDKATGNEVTNFNNLKEDQQYTIEVKVSPKVPTPSTTSSGTAAVAKGGSDKGKINVFKPELTFKDSEAYYGAAAPTYTDNLTKTEWKHATATGDILGTAPKLDISYTPDESKLESGKYTKQDVPVAATVKIGTESVNEHTTFVHQACTGQTCTLPEGKEFLIHVKTCQLTITKTGGKDGEPYVFTVKKDGQPYTEVTIVGNGTEKIVELPVGKYTIQENSAWSWRYNANNGSEAALSAANPTGTITCTNTLKNNYWLNGFSQVVKNIFRH